MTDDRLNTVTLFTSKTFVPGLEKWLLLTEILNMFRVELRAIILINCSVLQVLVVLRYIINLLLLNSLFMSVNDTSGLAKCKDFKEDLDYQDLVSSFVATVDLQMWPVLFSIENNKYSKLKWLCRNKLLFNFLPGFIVNIFLNGSQLPICKKPLMGYHGEKRLDPSSSFSSLVSFFVSHPLRKIKLHFRHTQVSILCKYHTL